MCAITHIKDFLEQVVEDHYDTREMLHAIRDVGL